MAHTVTMRGFDRHLEMRTEFPRRCRIGTRKHFTPEFKREAVQLLESGSRPASEIAREFGIARNHLYKWQTKLRARESEGPS